jgi:hypothetical protein
MPNDYNSDALQDAFARIAADLGVYGDQLKKFCQDNKPTASCQPCLDINNQPASAHASSDKQTQKRPCEPAVEHTSGSAKRPRTTSNMFCDPSGLPSGLGGHNGGGNEDIPLTLHAKAAAVAKPAHTDGSTDHLPRSDTCFSVSAADASSVVSSETASNTHDLDDRDEDIVLKEIQSYPEANTDSFDYVSTANQHIFHDRKAFETYQVSSSMGAQTCAKGICRNRPYATGRGTVRVEGRYGDRASSIRLTDVLHVPQAESNIISGVQLDKAGVTATLGNGRVTLSFQGANIVDGKICDELYRLNMRVIRPSNRFPAAIWGM